MIDTERIAELQAEIGAEDLSCIVSVYLEEARATLAQIAAGLTEEDHARAVHFLRSGALNIGMTCRAASSRDDCADRFRDVLDHTMAEVTDRLA